MSHISFFFFFWSHFFGGHTCILLLLLFWALPLYWLFSFSSQEFPRVLFPTILVQPELLLPRCVVLHSLVLKYFLFGWLELSKCSSSFPVTAVSFSISLATWAFSTHCLCSFLVIAFRCSRKNTSLVLHWLNPKPCCCFHDSSSGLISRLCPPCSGVFCWHWWGFLEMTPS